MSQERDWLEALPDDRQINVQEWERIIKKKFPKYEKKTNLNGQLHSMCNHKIARKMEIIRKGDKGNSQKLVRKLKPNEELSQHKAVEVISLSLKIPKWIHQDLGDKATRYGMTLESHICSILANYVEKDKKDSN